jgi:energy-coupling factor transporter ATP-binding protein EcfA2
MKLSFTSPHKSITFLPNTELPDFVVLTGVNGAGKSHLLEAIENGFIQVDDISVNPQTRPIRLFNWSNLVPNDSGAFSSYQITQERQGLWNEIFPQIQQQQTQITETLRQLRRFDLMKKDIHDLVKLTEAELLATSSNPEEASQIFQAIQNIGQNSIHNVTSHFVRNDPSRQRVIDSLQNSNIPLLAFREDDFYRYFPKNWHPVDMFQQSFGRLFQEYQLSFLNNRLKAMASQEGDSVSFFSDSEFIEQYGEPPWTFVNSILEVANLDFRINQPAKFYEERSSYEPILTDQVRGNQVRFADLSSGEKILMSFALCLYYAEDRRQLVDYPKVLLFDEIDAPLHPSMTQSLLRTIQKVLIERHGIRVIMTTHSPSTVALAPEEAIYAMSKDETKRLQKINKDKALSLLTAGVPTLSVNYENRRQVFVESKYDAEFYERIYTKLQTTLFQDVSLNFIPSGTEGKGSCEQVRAVVNQLYDGGNRTVYGVIDWDLKNNGNERVKVLGLGSRHSIENYVLDPLLLAAFLLREKWIERHLVGLGDAETYIHLGSFDNIRLQRIADFVVDKVRKHIESQSEEEKQQCAYIGGQVIELPVWFLHIQGHQLEKTLKEIFPELRRFQQPPQLKKEILAKVADDVPHLLSRDFVDLFHQIQMTSS